MKLRKGDEVQIVRGKDKGKKGKIEKSLTKLGKVMVTGVNQYKKHVKGNMQGQRSEIITITKALPVSNVMFMCPKCHKMARIGYKIDGTTKSRICKKCNQVI